MLGDHSVAWIENGLVVHRDKDIDSYLFSGYSYTMFELHQFNLHRSFIFHSKFYRKHLAIPKDTKSIKPIIFQNVFRAVFNLVKYKYG